MVVEISSCSILRGALSKQSGAYVGNQKSQVEEFFHVNLPGLKELPKAEAAKN